MKKNAINKHIGKVFNLRGKSSYRKDGKRCWYRYTLVCEVTGVNSHEANWYEATVREVTKESALPDDLQSLRQVPGKVFIVTADEFSS